MSGLHELSVTRLIDAPVEAVWRAWTEHGAEWFCPPPWRAEIEVQELRAGGASKLTMYGPDGEVMAHQGVFLEVVPNERIVSTDAFTAGWVPNGPFMVRIDTFADEGGKTRYTATARHWDAETKARHETMGFHQGWGMVAEQLEAVAKRISAEPHA
jgi:uncharacterized protein YndB with AHSA1/START domain